MTTSKQGAILFLALAVLAAFMGEWLGVVFCGAIAFYSYFFEK